MTGRHQSIQSRKLVLQGAMKDLSRLSTAPTNRTAVPVSNVSELAGILTQDLTDHHSSALEETGAGSLLLSHWNMSLT